MQLQLASVISLLAAITPALADTIAVTQLQQLTQQTVNTRDLVKGITLNNMGQNFPQVTAEMEQALALRESLISTFPSSLDADDQAALCENYVNFATVTQDLVAALTEKKPAVASVTSYKTAAFQLLQQGETMDTTIIDNVDGVASTCAEKVKDPRDKLLVSYDEAIGLYQ